MSVHRVCCSRRESLQSLPLGRTLSGLDAPVIMKTPLASNCRASHILSAAQKYSVVNEMT